MGKHRHVFLFCINSVIVTGDGQFVSNIWRNVKWKPVPTTTKLHNAALRCIHWNCSTVNWHVCTYGSGLSIHETSYCLRTTSCIYINFFSVIYPFPLLLLNFVSWLLLPPDLSLHTSSFSYNIPKPLTLTRHRSPLPFPFSSLFSSHILHTRPTPCSSQYYPTFSHVIVLAL